MEAVKRTFADLWDWLITLPPDFAFLLTLPFLVALTGVLADLSHRSNQEKLARSAKQPGESLGDASAPIVCTQPNSSTGAAPGTLSACDARQMAIRDSGTTIPIRRT